MKSLITYAQAAAVSLVLLFPARPLSAAPPRPFDSEVILRPSDNISAFGSLVAIDGDTAVVSDALGAGSGVYVFVRNGCDWVQQAKLPLFVSSIAISGNTIAAGGTVAEHTGVGPGEVHVFVRNGSVWTEQAVIPAPADHIGPADTRQFFGVSVALWSNTLVVGDPGDQEKGFRSGAAFVYRRECGKWVERAKLMDPNEQSGDSFGFAVATDRFRTIVGAPDGGYADVFLLGAGLKWQLEGRFQPAEAAGGNFGRAVDVKGVDAVVGDSDHGRAYVFRATNRTWAQTAVLKGNDTTSCDGFGWAVALSGNTIVVGAPLEGDLGYNAGAAYIFNRRGQTWSQLQKLAGSDTNADDNFGIAVAIWFKNVIIGRARPNFPETGEAYIYTNVRCCGCN